jgi:hypothetical protein
MLEVYLAANLFDQLDSTVNHDVDLGFGSLIACPAIGAVKALVGI